MEPQAGHGGFRRRVLRSATSASVQGTRPSEVWARGWDGRGRIPATITTLARRLGDAAPCVATPTIHPGQGSTVRPPPKRCAPSRQTCPPGAHGRGDRVEEFRAERRQATGNRWRETGTDPEVAPFDPDDQSVGKSAPERDRETERIADPETVHRLRAIGTRRPHDLVDRAARDRPRPASTGRHIDEDGRANPLEQGEQADPRAPCEHDLDLARALPSIERGRDSPAGARRAGQRHRRTRTRCPER
jgi:hypothetical protein